MANLAPQPLPLSPGGTVLQYKQDLCGLSMCYEVWAVVVWLQTEARVLPEYCLCKHL